MGEHRPADCSGRADFYDNPKFRSRPTGRRSDRPASPPRDQSFLILKGGQTSQFAISARPVSSTQPAISAQSVTLVVSRTCPEFSAPPHRFGRKTTLGACYSSDDNALVNCSQGVGHRALYRRDQSISCENRNEMECSCPNKTGLSTQSA